MISIYLLPDCSSVKPVDACGIEHNCFYSHLFRYWLDIFFCFICPNRKIEPIIVMIMRQMVWI